MDTGTVVSWEKNIGDLLEEGDVLAEIETDKAVMSMETPYQGYLATILKPAGSQNIAINDPIAIIVTKKDEVKHFENFQISDLTKETVSVKDKAKSFTSTSTNEIEKTIKNEEILNDLNKDNVLDAKNKDRVFASPYAKKIAKENNIDINLISISGSNERIKCSDVLNFKSEKSTESLKNVTSNIDQVNKNIICENVNYIDVPLTNMRKVIATRLSQSKQTTPHYYLTSEINMDNLIKLRADFNTKLQKDNIKLSINDFVVKAAGICLTLVPESNSSWMDTFIRQYKNVDINIAVSTDTGLYTPFVKDINFKGLVHISKEIKILADKARNNKLLPSEFQGGTFTISNLGMFGIKSFSAIINPPQCGILAIGSVQKIIAPDYENKPIVQNVMCATLCADHRIIDGALGAIWIKNFKNLLEDPIQMLL